MKTRVREGDDASDGYKRDPCDALFQPIRKEERDY